jgi:phage terminase small subunit
MPRKSAAALSVVHADIIPERIKPRVDASARVRAIFGEIVAQVPPNHFRPTDAALVEQYAQAIALGRQAFAALEAEGPVVGGRASPWVTVLEKMHRSAVALSARLRLTPQSRTDPKTVGRQKYEASAYDLIREGAL